MLRKKIRTRDTAWREGLLLLRDIADLGLLNRGRAGRGGDIRGYLRELATATGEIRGVGFFFEQRLPERYVGWLNGGRAGVGRGTRGCLRETGHRYRVVIIIIIIILVIYKLS